MDEYWNESQTAPSTLDDFFDEKSTVTWTGLANDLQDNGTFNNSSLQSIPQRNSADASASSILDSSSLQSDLGPSSSRIGISTKGVGKTLGEKLDSWKGSSGVSLIWNKSESAACLQCADKDEQISHLKGRLERTFSKYDITLPPEDTIRRIILGLPYSLECYKFHVDKISLLEAALGSNDASVILSIILFLKKTLTKKLFDEELLKRPIATLVYVDYLKNCHENIEAIHILKMIGRVEEAAILMFNIADNSKETKNRVKNLKTTLHDYFGMENFSHEARMIGNSIQLLEHQIPLDTYDSKDQKNQFLLKYPRASSIIGQPLLTTLFYCCMYHWDTSASKVTSPMTIKKKFSINDQQFLWTVLRARARVNYWPLPSELDNLLMPSGLLRSLSNLSGIGGNGQIVKDTLPVDRVINSLVSSNAPANVLAAYIDLVPSLEEKLKLATQYKCHQAVIDACIAQKDYHTLKRYLQEIPHGCPEYIKAEDFLKSV